MCQIVTVNVISFCRFQDCTQVLHFGLSCWLQSLLCFFFLLTVVDVMIILNEFSHSSPFLVQWFLKCRYSPLTSSVWLLQFTLIHGPNILGSYVILFFTASDFTSITSHIHNWALFLLWLHLFILSGAISPLFSSSILGTYRPGSSSFSVISFCLFILFMGFSRQKYWSGFPFHSPVLSDHILSELSTMTRLSWVALHGMAHSFIELDKAEIHVSSLVSFLWSWFSLCLPSDR